MAILFEVEVEGARVCLVHETLTLFRIECAGIVREALGTREAGDMLGSVIMTRLSLAGAISAALPSSESWA